jgi:hypothetical protein
MVFEAKSHTIESVLASRGEEGRRMTLWERVQTVLALTMCAVIVGWAVIAAVTPHERLEAIVRPIVKLVLDRFWP